MGHPTNVQQTDAFATLQLVQRPTHAFVLYLLQLVGIYQRHNMAKLQPQKNAMLFQEEMC